MIRLTNAMTGFEGHLVAINPAHVVVVYTVFAGETRIRAIGLDEEFIVKESFDEILAALSAGQSSAQTEKQ